MPANFSRLDILLGGDASGAIKAFETVDEQFKRFQYKVAQSNIDKPGGGGGMGQLVDVAKAGAASYAFQKVAESVRDASTALRTGQSAGEAFASVFNKIPIAGQLNQAGVAIREIITGEKAAIVEAEKWSKATTAISDGYRAIAFTQQLRGKRGDERASIGIEQGESDQVRASHERQKELQDRLNTVQSSDSNIGFYTQTQYNEMKRLGQAIALERENQIDAGREAVARQKMLKEDAALRQIDFNRNIDEQIFSAEASNKEKILRRTGRGLESAMVAVEEKARADRASRAASIRPELLDQLGLSPQDRAERIHNVARAELVEAKSTQLSLDGLRDEYARRDIELASDVQEKITHIMAEGAIERKKLTHDELGAELATIQEAYRVGIVEAEKKQRETRRLKMTDDMDPALQQERKALALKAGIGSDLAKDKDKERSAKEQLSIEEKLSRFRMESLRARDTAGDIEARREVEILEIQEKFKEKMLQINALEQDRNVTIAQRQQLSRLAVDAAVAENADIYKLDHSTQTFRGATAKTENSAHLSGLAQASREATEPKQIVKYTAEAAKNTAEMLVKLGEILTAFQKQTSSFTLPQFR